MCATCRANLQRIGSGSNANADCQPRPVCFLCYRCYRADLERQRALRVAGQLETASVERFQDGLPFERVNVERLARLKKERVESRAAGGFLDKRRHAQIAARRALDRLADGLDERIVTPVARARFQSAALRAAELQLPEAWLPFAGSR